jgi:hypothetical protein
MPVLKLTNFSGISPRTGPSNLQDNQAQTARNLKLQSGEIRAWRNPVYTYTTGLPDSQTIYQLQNLSTGATRWLEWATDVDVVPSPAADTTDFRIYYTDGTAPKKTNWNLATTSGTGSVPYPNAYLNMGVPAPAAAPTASASGGTSPTETRSYIYTYVSTFGSVLEESAPSAAVLVTCNSSGATVTIGGFTNAPTTNYNITALRIYRSVSGTTSAQYQYVGQVTINPSTGVPTSSTFADTLTVAQLGISLPSLYYTTPPSALKGLIAMPNGILAGFVGNQVWFCEPYLPHAWPVSYMMTVGAPIVGLGVFGQTLVVCTTQVPYLISGSTPGSMTQTKLPLPEPCVAKRSIASDQFGVLYASPNGLVSIAPGTQDVISRQLFTRDEWQTYSPTSMVGLIYQNMYLGFYQNGSSKSALVIMRGDTPPLVTLDVPAKAVFVARNTSNVYYVSTADNAIYQLDADTVNNTFFEWKSKKFISPHPVNFGALKLQADWIAIANVAAYNAIVAGIAASNNAIWSAGTPLKSTLASDMLNDMTLGGSILQTVPTAQAALSAQVILYAEGVPVYSQGITSQEPIRLPADNKAYIWEFGISGNVPVRELAVGTSIGELRQA